MADGRVGVKQAATPDIYVDNEVLTTSLGTVHQQRVRVSNRGDISFGDVVSLAPGASLVVAEIVAVEGYKLHGFSATGNGDGYFFLQVDDVTILSGRIHAMNKSICPYAQIGTTITTGATVSLKVRNESESSCDYEGSILGEF